MDTENLSLFRESSSTTAIEEATPTADSHNGQASVSSDFDEEGGSDGALFGGFDPRDLLSLIDTDTESGEDLDSGMRSSSTMRGDLSSVFTGRTGRGSRAGEALDSGHGRSKGSKISADEMEDRDDVDDALDKVALRNSFVDHLRDLQNAMASIHLSAKNSRQPSTTTTPQSLGGYQERILPNGVQKQESANWTEDPSGEHAEHRDDDEEASLLEWTHESLVLSQTNHNNSNSVHDMPSTLARIVALARRDLMSDTAYNDDDQSAFVTTPSSDQLRERMYRIIEKSRSVSPASSSPGHQQHMASALEEDTSSRQSQMSSSRNTDTPEMKQVKGSHASLLLRFEALSAHRRSELSPSLWEPSEAQSSPSTSRNMDDTRRSSSPHGPKKSSPDLIDFDGEPSAALSPANDRQQHIRFADGYGDGTNPQTFMDSKSGNDDFGPLSSTPKRPLEPSSSPAMYPRLAPDLTLSSSTTTTSGPSVDGNTGATRMRNESGGSQRAAHVAAVQSVREDIRALERISEPIVAPSRLFARQDSRASIQQQRHVTMESPSFDSEHGISSSSKKPSPLHHGGPTTTAKTHEDVSPSKPSPIDVVSSGLRASVSDTSDKKPSSDSEADEARNKNGAALSSKSALVTPLKQPSQQDVTRLASSALKKTPSSLFLRTLRNIPPARSGSNNNRGDMDNNNSDGGYLNHGSPLSSPSGSGMSDWSSHGTIDVRRFPDRPYFDPQYPGKKVKGHRCA